MTHGGRLLSFPALRVVPRLCFEQALDQVLLLGVLKFVKFFEAGSSQESW